jgi:hypothetical protein
MVTRRQIPRQRRRPAASTNEGPRREHRKAEGDPATTVTEHAEHLHGRPDWNCLTCRQPWPCPEARAGLLAEFRTFPSVLTVYLCSQMYDAMADLTAQGDPAPTNIYERFLSWSRNR